MAGSPGCKDRDGLISDKTKLKGEPDERGKIFLRGRGFKKVFCPVPFVRKWKEIQSDSGRLQQLFFSQWRDFERKGKHTTRFNLPMSNPSRISLASSLWPTSSKASVASWPPTSRRTSSPPLVSKPTILVRKHEIVGEVKGEVEATYGCSSMKLLVL